MASCLVFFLVRLPITATNSTFSRIPRSWAKAPSDAYSISISYHEFLAAFARATMRSKRFVEPTSVVLSPFTVNLIAAPPMTTKSSTISPVSFSTGMKQVRFVSSLLQAHDPETRWFAEGDYASYQRRSITRSTRRRRHNIYIIRTEEFESTSL